MRSWFACGTPRLARPSFLVEVDGEVTSAKVGNFNVRVDRDDRVVSAGGEEGGDTHSGVGSVVVREFW